MDQENALDLLYHALREILPDKNAKELSEAAMIIYQSLQDELRSPQNETNTKNAAQTLRAIPSEKRAQASRENGKKGGRKRRCSECKEEIKPGDSWERHSYGKGRYVYCSNCAERIRQEQYETDRMEDRRYP